MKRKKVINSGIVGSGIIFEPGLYLFGRQPWGMKGHGGHGDHWGKLSNLTPEQAGKLFDLRQKFLDDTASMRKGHGGQESGVKGSLAGGNAG